MGNGYEEEIAVEKDGTWRYGDGEKGKRGMGVYTGKRSGKEVLKDTKESSKRKTARRKGRRRKEGLERKQIL